MNSAVRSHQPLFTHRTRFAIAALTAALALLVGGVETVRYAMPVTVCPSDANFKANPAANGRLLVDLSTRAGKPCDVIFIGASNVEYWQTEGRAVWERYYAPRHAFDFGVAGDKTQDVLWRLDHTNLRGLHPKVAVVFAGLNNLGSSPREIAMGVHAITNKTQVTFPGIRILVVSLIPNGWNDAKAAETNAILRTFADDRSLFYVDLYSHMPREGDNWHGLGPDRFHLSPNGYQAWAEQMEPVMQRLLSPPPAIASSASGLAPNSAVQ